MPSTRQLVVLVAGVGTAFAATYGLVRWIDGARGLPMVGGQTMSAASSGPRPGRAGARPAAVSPDDGGGAEEEAETSGFQEAPDGQPHTVLFVVLDTVRSKNLSLCGYERPTTPFMEKLVEREGTAWTCQAYTPEAWTLPSHSSYFSGLTVPEHGVVRTGIPFPEEPTTLAEIFREKGYQTALVSGNGALAKASGLQRGFQVNRVSVPTRKLRVRALSEEVEQVLARADPDKPLFLFVNIYDAHDPYPRIPPGVDWVPPQPELQLFEDDMRTEKEDFVAFTHGRMSSDKAKPFLANVRNGYDYGISLADKSLSLVFKALKAAGRTQHGFRYLITSDHGEFLGEHDNLRHGCFIYEEVTRVPFIYHDDTREDPIEVHGPFASMNAFHLLQTGELPEEPLLPSAVSRKRPGERPSATMAGIWASPTEKIVWKEGDFLQFDLERDPHEGSPSPLGDHPLRAELESLADSLNTTLAKNVENNPELEKMLQALGYMDQ